MNNTNIGSTWGRWDLHIHTKNTKKNDQFRSETFDDFCYQLFKKAINNKIRAIGITDYFCIENYKKVYEYKNNLDSNKLFEKEEKEEIKKMLIIPNVELRILPTTKKGRLINIHCLFNPKYVNKLDNDFFSTLEHSAGNRKFKMNKNGFIGLGEELGIELDPDNKNYQENLKKALKMGINNFAISHAELQKLLDENDELRSNTITIVSNSNQDGASGVQQHYDMFENGEGALDGVRQAIYKLSDIVFSSNESDIKFFKGQSKLKKTDFIRKVGSIKPCVHGSDAHTEDKLFLPDKNRYCWIKANPTFEGLKQIIYEPSRVHIGENCPQHAIHKLDSLSLDFNEEIKWENDTFWFSNFSEKLFFSPYLTCIIGGRGSGKSTLLNLIAKKVNKLDFDFFNKLNNHNIHNNVNFEPQIVDNIEFLGQNTIEEFAKDSKKFTFSIFERLNKKSDNHLELLEKEISNNLVVFEDQIKLLKKREEKHKELNEKKNELLKYNELLKTITEKKFLENTKNLQHLQKEIIQIEESRNRFEKIYLSVKEITTMHEQISNINNNYDEHYNELISDLSALFNKFKNKDYTKEKNNLKELKYKAEMINDEIKIYLQEKGMNKENIQDVQFANTHIELIKEEIKKIKKDIRSIKKDKRNFSTNIIDKNIDSFNTLINKELTSINKIFTEISNKNTDDVKIINISYELNSDIFKIIFSELVNKINLENQISTFKSTFYDYLKEIDINDVISYKNSADFIEKITPRPTKAYDKLKEVFKDQLNFEIYKLIIEKNKRDIKNNKILKVNYDNKRLEDSSFGQRCTAAIVVLLSLGNNPIIIDEPEAHLDSSLIANYLVELIKEQKQNRQVIFATHNANFVLNADAELIIKLENKDGLTKSKSFSIEEIAYRHDLLKLEGGKDAFQKRELKYNIKNLKG